MSDAEPTHLDRILATKRAQLAQHRHDRLTDRKIEDALAGLGPTRDFEGALRQGMAPRIIAEFKRASPSAGVIREGASITEVVRGYVEAGAAAVSVLTDSHFGGSLDDLARAREVCPVPVLCKDFILERGQLLDARRAGADAVLLIAAVLQPPTLKQLIEFAHAIELQVLCEAHDDHEVDRAMSAGARVVGVNARDLRTFEVDPELPIRLRRSVPKNFTYVAESGVQGLEDLLRLRDAGVDAALVGTALMSADDPARALAELLNGLDGGH
ncbi:indole-3-glycerol phosphate synthase TrpC [Paraliomyxa miuraensis]|uniref:indole-3-glycerol phosphate synthase TrpC n=1 Tax=Paraliomyxa miuraensis TaxID=376150 RepID=UPI00225A7D56|nr:indole-3-glycerol phosphate synthase TrpC [Paraliomyxa miuraensis]MCX4245756.1 indole-3-glycerol phosphate synthase TrpC [Paraliomyxa miuraensis]